MTNPSLDLTMVCANDKRRAAITGKQRLSEVSRAVFVRSFGGIPAIGSPIIQGVVQCVEYL